jgi:uncharacterized membrane protein YgcG
MMQDTAALENRQHSHVFDEGNPLAERNTRWVVWLTATMMVAEITGGWIFNSMALLADGWHMSSHAFALGLSVLAYGRHADSPMTRASPSAPGRSRSSAAIPVRSFWWSLPDSWCTTPSSGC